MQKHVHLVDLVKRFPTNIFFQNLASIQKRTSPKQFDHLAEKSDEGSTSNLSTKRGTAYRRPRTRACADSTSHAALVLALHKQASRSKSNQQYPSNAVGKLFLGESNLSTINLSSTKKETSLSTLTYHNSNAENGSASEEHRPALYESRESHAGSRRHSALRMRALCQN